MLGLFFKMFNIFCVNHLTTFLDKGIEKSDQNLRYSLNSNF